MLTVFAVVKNFHHSLYLKEKPFKEEKLLGGVIVKCQDKKWMDNDNLQKNALVITWIKYVLMSS